MSTHMTRTKSGWLFDAYAQGEDVSVRVLDHIIVGKGAFVSLKEWGVGFDR